MDEQGRDQERRNDAMKPAATVVSNRTSALVAHRIARTTQRGQGRDGETLRRDLHAVSVHSHDLAKATFGTFASPHSQVRIVVRFPVLINVVFGGEIDGCRKRKGGGISCSCIMPVPMVSIPDAHTHTPHSRSHPMFSSSSGCQMRT
jgi:hypothetical protein